MGNVKRSDVDTTVAAAISAQLITLRWLAAICIIGLTPAAVRELRLPLPALELTLLGVWIGAYNGALIFASRRVENPKRLIVAQVILDWVSLAICVHLTGGIDSPALIFFLVHVVVVAILLPEQSPYVYVGAVIAFVALDAYWGIFPIAAPYQPIDEFPDALIGAMNEYFRRALWQGAFFGAALVGTAVISRAISAALQHRERRLLASLDETVQANTALHESEAQRKQFVHMVTHELRSPVTAAQSLIRVLLGGLAGTLTATQTDMLNRLSRRLDALLSLINDLLALQASRAAVTLKPVTVQPLIAVVIDDARIEAAEKRIALTCTCPDPALAIMATEEGVLRIAGNLIGNAVKYTPAGGAINVTLCPEPDGVAFSVQDTGIGIPPDALARIGEEFFRAENAHASGIVGTGLGMATVTGLVKQFGGTFSVQSEVGKGSTFTVTFPQ